MREKPWYVYVLLCKDGSLYCGISPDVETRVERHNSGRGAKYTQARRPCVLVASWRFEDCSAAASAEAKFKKQERSQKIATIASRSWQSGVWDIPALLKTKEIIPHKGFEEGNNAF